MKKIAIIGASYLQLPLVQKARELGLETHCFAWNDGAVCKDYADFFYPVSVLDKEQILKICAAVKVDGITTIATDVAVPTISYVAGCLGLIANTSKSALQSTNKEVMRACFKRNDVKIPEYVSLTDFDPLRVADFQFPVIVKPVDRSGSRGVTKVNEIKDLEEAFGNAAAESLSGKAIVEEFIGGNEISVESISWRGRHYILAITDKITTGSPHFVELAHHQPTQLPEEIQARVHAETRKVLDAVGIENGAAHSEFKITAEGNIFAIEVGARMGGDFIGSHLVSLSTGYDFLKGVIDVALNQFTPPGEITQKKHSGVYFLCEDTQSLLPFFEEKQDFEVYKAIQDTQLKKANNSNDRSGYLIYQSSEKINIL